MERKSIKFDEIWIWIIFFDFHLSDNPASISSSPEKLASERGQSGGFQIISSF